MENEMGYILANGPEGLTKVLNELLEKSKVDASLKNRAHFILYEVGNQKSLIKMDLKEWPLAFWYYDLLGRPATSIVKDILARFAWDKGGEKEWYYKEKGKADSEEAAFTDWRETVFENKS